MESQKADCSHLPEGYLPLNKEDDMKHTPAPWIFYVDEKHSNDMGRIIGLNETEICGFGDSSPYDAAEGFIPRKEDFRKELYLKRLEEYRSFVECITLKISQETNTAYHQPSPFSSLLFGLDSLHPQEPQLLQINQPQFEHLLLL